VTATREVRLIRATELVGLPVVTIGWSDIHAVGTDAVVVDNEAALRASQNDAEQRVIDDDLTILGKIALDDLGDEIGLVADLEFDPDDGRVRQLTVLDHPIEGSRIRGIGTYAVVVAADES
jgi:sporulation protein YlmC with PRC-barrel domain